MNRRDALKKVAVAIAVTPVLMTTVGKAENVHPHCNIVEERNVVSHFVRQHVLSMTLDNGHIVNAWITANDREPEHAGMSFGNKWIKLLLVEARLPLRGQITTYEWADLDAAEVFAERFFQQLKD